MEYSEKSDVVVSSQDLNKIKNVLFKSVSI